MIALGLYFLLVQIGSPYLSQLQRYKPTNIYQNLTQFWWTQSLTTLCEPERAPHRRVCCGISLSLYIYIHIFLVRRAVSHIRLLFCAFLRHLLIRKLFTNYSYLNSYSTEADNSARRHQPSSNSKDGDHSWTYLFNG